MKKNSSLTLSLLLLTTLSLSFSGCGEADEELVKGIVDEIVSDKTGQGEIETLPSLEGVAKYSNIVIFRNVSDFYVKLSHDTDDEYKFKRVSSSVHCTDFGFTNAQAITNDFGSGVITTYSDDSTLKSCTDTNFLDFAYASGSSTVIAYNNNI